MGAAEAVAGAALGAVVGAEVGADGELVPLAVQPKTNASPIRTAEQVVDVFLGTVVQRTRTTVQPPFQWATH